MKLYEFEGHKILAKAGIESPFFVVCENLDEVRQARKRLKFPIVAKVQVLAGRRGRGGGIKICTTEKQLFAFCKAMFANEFNGEQVRFITLSEKVEIEKEYYVSITYDTVKRTAFLMFCEKGGVDIEEVKQKDPEAIKRVDIDPFDGPREKDLAKILPKEPGNFAEVIMRMWDAFWRWDCRLVEINPLALRPIRKTQGKQAQGKLGKSGDEFDYVAIDAKIILDDSGLVRHRDLDVLPKGAISSIPTERELQAKQIDQEDYRGSAGSTFIELDGDIAILASGGGASLLVMDSLVASGGKPANYTEYSGNPPAEKVQKLTKITLTREGSRKDLAGCLVAGAVANFTDILETLSGFARGLKQIRPKPVYPIVIRRGGPKQEEAYKKLEKFAKEEDFDIHLFGPETPISVACQEMVRLSEEYKKQLKAKN